MFIGTTRRLYSTYTKLGADQLAEDFGMKEYWCVICENCKAVIPLLESDPKKRRQNPQEFQATCLRCKSASAFDVTELELRQIEPAVWFHSQEGFSNV
jgi:hypothetical protein